jgi:TM2 domain-containing membrane protein YozV
MHTLKHVPRITDSRDIEARLLDLAHTSTVKLTATVLAYYAPCAIDDAQKVLDDLAARNVLSMDVDDDGGISYEMKNRQQLPAAVAAPRRPQPQQNALLRWESAPRSSILAGLLSVWIPGAGHLYAGRVAAAIVWFLAVGAGYVLILPGLILHLFCIISAASAARLRTEPARYALPPAAAA